ncbi:unnamed protein product [Closterium sp. NIES-53]
MPLRTRRDLLRSSSLFPPSVCRSQPYSLRSYRCRRRRCRRLHHPASYASGSVLPPAIPLPRATPPPRAIPLSLRRYSRAPFASFRHALAALLPLVLLSSILPFTNPPCHVALAATLDVMTPKGGCLTSRCVSYTKGRWLLSSGTASTIISANGNMNYERYKLIDSTTVILKTPRTRTAAAKRVRKMSPYPSSSRLLHLIPFFIPSPSSSHPLRPLPSPNHIQATNESGCCQTCAQADKCVFFHYQPPTVAGTAGTCRLLPTLTKFTVDNTITSVPPSYIGGKCNPLATVKNDPHFVGAEGTRFDFHGDLNRSFCLLTDRDLHINMGIKGYEDPRLVVAGRRGGKRRHRLPIRSWIRELYMTWRDPFGRQHSVFMKARDGKEQRRGERGFIERMEIDGRSISPPTQVGQAVQGEGPFHMVLLSTGPMGDGRDRDTYSVRVGGVASMDLSLHAAHPLLQTADEAHTHFNVYIKYLNNTDAVHGVLGQTFRGEITRSKRAEEYGLLTRLLRAPIQADGETGRGFLDGDVEDYATSAIDAADCAFAMAWNEARKKVREELLEVGEEQGASGKAEEEARGQVEEAQEEVQKEVRDEAWEEVRQENMNSSPMEGRDERSKAFGEVVAGRRVEGDGEQREQQQDDLTGEGDGGRERGEGREGRNYREGVRENGSGEMWGKILGEDRVVLNSIQGNPVVFGGRAVFPADHKFDPAGSLRYCCSNPAAKVEAAKTGACGGKSGGTAAVGACGGRPPGEQERAAQAVAAQLGSTATPAAQQQQKVKTSKVATGAAAGGTTGAEGGSCR